MTQDNITVPQFAGILLNTYEMNMGYVVAAEQTEATLSDAYPILLISKDGEHKQAFQGPVDFDRYPQFKWAESTYTKLRQDIKELEKLPQAEASLWHLFQAQGGVLALCEGGCLDAKALKAGQFTWKTFDDDTNKPQPSQPGQNGQPLGVSNAGIPLISINATARRNAQLEHKTLVHELAHNACNFIGIDFASSELFKACLAADRIQGSCALLEEIRNLEKAIEQKRYKRENFYPELFAKLQEMRLKAPQKFARNMPALEAFYTQIVYPIVSAAFQRQEKSLEFMKSETFFLSRTQPVIDLQNQEQKIKALQNIYATRLTKEYKKILDYYPQGTIIDRTLAEKAPNWPDYSRAEKAFTANNEENLQEIQSDKEALLNRMETIYKKGAQLRQQESSPEIPPIRTLMQKLSQKEFLPLKKAWGKEGMAVLESGLALMKPDDPTPQKPIKTGRRQAPHSVNTRQGKE